MKWPTLKIRFTKKIEAINKTRHFFHLVKDHFRAIVRKNLN